jgi:3-keto-5-aminohexanoate cleavage enzyme
MNDKVIISAALNGNDTPISASPFIPVKPEHVADEAVRSYEAGAAVVHIHARNDAGEGVMDYKRYEDTVNIIRRKNCPVVINITSSGAFGVPHEDRSRPAVGNKAEICSFDAGSMNFGDGVFVNSPDFLEYLATELQKNEIRPEIEVFETGFIDNAMRIAKKGLIDPPYWFQFVLGVPGGMAASVRNLTFLVDSLPEGSVWSALGVGRFHLPILYAALAMGGHVRVGIEDNIYYKKGVLAKSNVEFVTRAVRLAEEMERPIATPDDAREILKLKRKA